MESLQQQNQKLTAEIGEMKYGFEEEEEGEEMDQDGQMLAEEESSRRKAEASPNDARAKKLKT